MEAMWNEIFEKQKKIEGLTGLYFKNLVTGETRGYQEEKSYWAASVVKFPLMMVMMLLRERGETDFSEQITIKDDQKIPGCGAVKNITGDATLDIHSLMKMMITISDNTATNALFRHYGAETIKKCMKELGFQGTQFNRQYYDFESEYAGINNYIVPKELGIALEKIYKREMISEIASEEMEQILSEQQINHKINGYLDYSVKVAHKTGEEDFRTHDVGIVFAKEPFVICFASDGVNVPEFEVFIRETVKKLFDVYNK